MRDKGADATPGEPGRAPARGQSSSDRPVTIRVIWFVPV